MSFIRLASGATWQSSGQGIHLQNTLIQTHLTKYSKQLYEKLERDGHDIGIHMFMTMKSLLNLYWIVGYAEKGSIWVAQTSDRLHTLKRQYATIKPLGIGCEILNLEKIKEKLPIIDPHEIWVKKERVVSELKNTICSVGWSLGKG